MSSDFDWFVAELKQGLGYRPEHEVPNIGEATTRHLLAELCRRGESEQRYEKLGALMASVAAEILEQLPHQMLDYRTVDG